MSIEKYGVNVEETRGVGRGCLLKGSRINKHFLEIRSLI